MINYSITPNGKIYCVPSAATDTLIIDKNSSVHALGIKAYLITRLSKL